MFGIRVGMEENTIYWQIIYMLCAETTLCTELVYDKEIATYEGRFAETGIEPKLFMENKCSIELLHFDPKSER